MNSFFTPPTTEDLAVMNKRNYCNLLTALLFENMMKNRGGVKPLQDDTIHAILRKIDAFGPRPHLQYLPYQPGHDTRCRMAVYAFCSLPNLPLHLMHAALKIIRRPLEMVCTSREVHSLPDTTATWVYEALQNVYASRTHPTAVEMAADLIGVLVPYGEHIAKPNIASLHAILWAISLDVNYGDTSDIHLVPLKSVAFTCLTSAVHWFRDRDLQPVLQEHDVWANLGSFTTELPSCRGYYSLENRVAPSPPFVREIIARYYALGNDLSSDSTWKTIIWGDLPGWLAHTWMMKSSDFFELPETATTRQQFQDGLARIWDADAVEGDRFGHEKSLVMAFTSLANFWDHIESLALERFDRLVNLIKSTVSTAFCTRILDSNMILGIKLNNPSQEFLDVVVARLGRAVTSVVERSKQTEEPNLDDDLQAKLDAAVGILSNLAETILGELRSGWPHRIQGGVENMVEKDEVIENAEVSEVKYWAYLRDTFSNDLSSLC
ncbi:hypothetical protein C8R43DRAFT_272762 [Mycena crocata]|nr:hypothetical protein C8R43DRAFT_272762 [Mycena crocata]